MRPATATGARIALASVLGILLLSASSAASQMEKPGGDASLSGQDRALRAFPENTELRQRDLDSFIRAPISRIASSPLARENASGIWLRQTRVLGQSVYLIYSAARGKSWPLYSQGSWIIRRDLRGGAFSQAKVFLRSDTGTFIRLFPDKDRTRLDLVIQGAMFREGVALPWSFESSLGRSMRDIFAATRDSVDWSLFDPDAAAYGQTKRLAEAVRSRLATLRYADDGGLDAEGKPVFIASGHSQPAGRSGLNCSGFAQWLVDGLLTPLGFAWPSSARLAEKKLDTRKSSAVLDFEDGLDPYFGLDWTRNLSLVAAAALEGSRKSDPRSNDVTDSPFARVALPSDPVRAGQEFEDFAPYAEDAGHAIEGLPGLLWWLAIKEPGYFYLASISKQDKAGLRHHYHVAVLMPRFDGDGSFKVDVFESDAETGLATLVARTKGQMVHLVRVRVGAEFDPPSFGAAAAH